MKNLLQLVVARHSGCCIEIHLDVQPLRSQAATGSVEMSLDSADTSVRATSGRI
jgi:hypothetical protein